MARSLEEWIGKTDDSPVPPRVRLRIFQAYGGKCYKTGVRLVAGNWAIDHIKALILGGKNCESNMAPIWIEAHKEKTKAEMKIKAKVDRIARKHIGIKARKYVWPKRKFGQ
jgi:5-methylcytosine-specific restriction enzyme A